MSEREFSESVYQTAEDYDMEPWDVDRIFRNFPDDPFYELEQFVRQRSQRQ